jgi:DNA-binding transcriptional regulator PaaX
MVHNPKNSQKILGWCLESAINLVFQAVEGVHKKLNHSELAEYFNQNTSGLNVSNRQISRMIYDLKRRNYIQVDAGDSVKLTGKAKIKIIDKISNARVRDNKYRIISFDIPETKRANRNNFRRAIKRIGFRQVQKSLWVCDRNVGDLVQIAEQEYGVGDYVAYFVAECSTIDRYIKKILDVDG